MNLLTPGLYAPTVSVFRDADMTSDCTRNGISRRFTRLRVIGIFSEYLGEKRETLAASLTAPHMNVAENDVILVRRAPCGDRRADVLVPARAWLANYWTMMGGNYAADSDSRWSSLLSYYGAIPIHDRIET